LQNPHAGDVLGERGGDCAERLPHLAVRAPRALAEDRGRDHQRRDHGQDREGQAPVEQEEHDDRAAEHERVLDERGESVRHELIESLDVVRQAADQDAGAVALVEAEGQPLQVAEEVVAQVGEDPLARPPREVRLGVRADDPEEAGADERRHDPGEVVDLPVADVVDGEADQERRCKRDRRRCEERQDGERRAELVRAGQAVERG
jgi:hypothetical protein